MSGKITTFVNILVVGTVSVVSKAKYFCNLQFMPHLRQVLDREGVVHGRAGNREGQPGQLSV